MHPTAFLQPCAAPPTPEREPWPEIEQLTAEAAIRLPVGGGWYPGVKTGLDFIIAVLLLPCSAIAVGLAALAVRLTSRGPVFYTQTRVGLNGHLYRIVKIRTMYHNCESKSGIQWAKKGDSRVTPVGKFLRAMHIDELPQLWNVLRGEMSLVGPRPHVVGMKAGERELAQIVAEYAHRHRVKPGITGWAQINGSRGPVNSADAVRRRLKLDLHYVARASLWLDLEILVRTAPMLFGDAKATR
jgi:lipopolysaccharide/colanic/teichoic acid biosynthesis glycosyltransferase